MERLELGAGPRGRAEAFVLAAAIASLTLTEYFFAFVDPALGILSALASVTALYLALSLLSGGLSRALRESVEIVCLLQIYVLLISSLPWFFVGQELLLPTTYTILLALCLWHIKDAGLTLEEVGFRRAQLRHVVTAALAGVALGVV
ncbi:MAG: hypothetical protein N3H31_07955, partial [Candidatus Nezhaarchaeota archaeon]|nr:hypothetical protein [Candidatus Nezhaarchaeota archaeon]